ncbi:MAG: DUF4276 family protein [Ardenticatenaceae bacterium]
MSKPLVARPPIGFIVEGQGEYDCYPSLVQQIVGSKGFHIPRVHTGGVGSLVRNIRRYLRILVLTHHPFHIIITVDLKDTIKQKLARSCEQLKTDLEKQIKNWLENEAQQDARLQPLPERITVVIQIQTFETWLLADVASLVKAGYIKKGTKQPHQVDEHATLAWGIITKPAQWLRKRSKQDIKNPKYAKAMASQLDPEVMRSNSHSFDKFFREVERSYLRWIEACHNS